MGRRYESRAARWIARDGGRVGQASVGVVPQVPDQVVQRGRRDVFARGIAREDASGAGTPGVRPGRVEGQATGLPEEIAGAVVFHPRQGLDQVAPMPRQALQADRPLRHPKRVGQPGWLAQHGGDVPRILGIGLAAAARKRGDVAMDGAGLEPGDRGRARGQGGRLTQEQGQMPGVDAGRFQADAHARTARRDPGRQCREEGRGAGGCIGEAPVAVVGLAGRIGHGQMDAVATHIDAHQDGFHLNHLLSGRPSAIGEPRRPAGYSQPCCPISDWATPRGVLGAAAPAARGTGRTVGVSDGRTGARRHSSVALSRKEDVACPSVGRHHPVRHEAG